MERDDACEARTIGRKLPDDKTVALPALDPNLEEGVADSDPEAPAPTGKVSPACSEDGLEGGNPRAAPGGKRPCGTPAARRMLMVVLVIAGLVVAARLMGIHRYLSRERMLRVMKEAGPLGWILYIVLFALGEFIHLPGIVFVAAGIYSYGRVAGGLLAYVGSVFSVSVGFLLTRGLSGGATLDELGLSWASRAEQRVAKAPVATVAGLRLVFWLMPMLNQSMALTAIPFTSYLIGSMIGIVPGMLLMTLLLDKLLAMTAEAG